MTAQNNLKNKTLYDQDKPRGAPDTDLSAGMALTGYLDIGDSGL